VGIDALLDYASLLVVAANEEAVAGVNSCRGVVAGTFVESRV